jgi:hypothetical protein
LCLSQKRKKHRMNWRAHLKRETAGCNRSLSCRANMAVGLGPRFATTVFCNGETRPQIDTDKTQIVLPGLNSFC